MILRKREADILEGLREGKSQRALADTLGMNRATVTNVTARLRELCCIEVMAKHGRYKVLIDKYTVIDDMSKQLKRKKIQEIPVSEDIACYIRGHYKKFPRSHIAKKLGIPKTKYNFMVLQLGMGE